VVLLDNMTLAHLHAVIQVTMGWYNYHMYAFRIGGNEYTRPAALEGGEIDELGMQSDESVFLSRVITREKQKFLYEYDFGDGWVHEIIVEKILPIEPRGKYPVCLAGARACPPEDCGGVPGYANIIAALKAKKKTGEQEVILEWLEDDYNPQRFELGEINSLLAEMR